MPREPDSKLPQKISPARGSRTHRKEDRLEALVPDYAVYSVSGVSWDLTAPKACKLRGIALQLSPEHVHAMLPSSPVSLILPSISFPLLSANSAGRT
jgi:hypothetical protein